LSQIKKTIFTGVQVFFLSAQLTCAQGFDKGFSAYMLGDYETAIIEWRNKVNLGSVTAMANLGNMYEVGAGVEQSYILAHQWYNLAASNGDLTARENKKIIEKFMSADEVSSAISQARKCMYSGYVDCF
jgi:TPR repeat protein